MSDVSYHKYLQTITYACSSTGLQTMRAQMKASLKYSANVPVNFSGVTLMTPMGQQDPHAKVLYRDLAQIQNKIMQSHHQSLLAVPQHTFHITAADLIAGKPFEEMQNCYKTTQLYIDTLKRELQSAVSIKTGYLSSHTKRAASTVTWRYYGIAMFETALVALLAPVTQQAYTRLVELRTRIYGHDPLLDLGIKRPLPLMAHVTLAYVNDSHTTEALDRLALDLSQYQTQNSPHSTSSATYHWQWAQLHSFPHMEVYHPLEWKVDFTSYSFQ